MPRPVPVACLVVVLGVVSVQGYRRGQLESAPSTVPPAGRCSPEQRTEFGALEEGLLLGDFRVEQLDCNSPDRVEIEVDRNALRMKLIVEKTGMSPHDPPRKVGKYALFYNLQQNQLSPPELDALLDALARRLEAKAPPSASH